MSFSVGGGSGSVSGRSDVFLDTVVDSQVLSYDPGVAKWRNIATTGLPAGGTTGQILVKRTNTDGDVEWASRGVLSSANPLGAGDPAAGTAATAARSDHVHPIPAGVGSPLSTAHYTNPLGPPASTTTSMDAGKIRVSPFPVFRTINLGSVVPGLSGNTGTKNIQIAIFASHPGHWQPTTKVGPTLSVVLSDNTYVSLEPTYADGLELTPGLYWVAVLAVDAICSLLVLENKPLGNSYHVHQRFNAGSSSFFYHLATSYTSMPAALNTDGTPFLDNQTPFFFSFKPAA